MINKLLAFDVETTGLDPLISDEHPGDRIVQLAWIVFDRKEHLFTENGYIIKPNGYTIPEESIKIHGTSQEQALKDGHDFMEVFNLFRKDLKNCELVVAHNFDFDHSFLQSHYYFADPENFEDNIFDGKVIFDTMKSSDIINFCQLPNIKKKYRTGSQYKYPKLSELHQKLFGDDFSQYHNALADTRCTLKCLFEVINRGILDEEGRFMVRWNENRILVENENVKGISISGHILK